MAERERDALTLFRNSLESPVLKDLFTPPPDRRKRKVTIAATLARKPSKETITVIGPDGRLCVSVALEGPLGTGKRMVVDDASWRAITFSLGSRWTLKESKPGHAYVIGLGAGAGVTLARRIMGAREGQVVAFRNGDRLDLSLGNLEVVEAAAFIERTLRRQHKTT